MKDTPELPPGWSAEPLNDLGNPVVIYAANNEGMVTIDFSLRCYRLGHRVHRGWDDVKTNHKGPGWRSALVNDAVAHLQKALKGNGQDQSR